MIRLSQVCKAYGEQVLFDNASLVLTPGERLGLLGRNGHGKSTLLRILAGLDEFDSGRVELPRDTRVGFLQQHLKFQAATVLDEVKLSLPVSHDGMDLTFVAEKILSGLGFSQDNMRRPPSEFSGGYQVRISLASLLVSEPDLLLLDEPTNYLDIPSIRWLEKFLVNWPGTLMIVTHDAGFMDAVSTHTAMIHRGEIHKYEGGTQKVYQSIAEQESLHERTIQNKLKKREETQAFIDRFRAKASKARQVQSRIKALEREGELTSLEEIRGLDFSFPFAPFSGKRLAKVEEVSFGFDREAPALFKDISLSIQPGDRIGIIGRNGSGKTTLLEVLAGNLATWSGNLSYHADAKVGYYGQTNVDRLDPNKTIEEEILLVHPERNRTRARTIAGVMMFQGDEALKKIQVLSGGERARVLLGKLLSSPSNILFLDEPTHHLDVYSAAALEEAISEFPGAVVCVTHDEKFLKDFSKRLVVFDQGSAQVFEGGYNDFLDSVGWSGEERTQRKVSGEKLSKKELRRRRAQMSTERAQLLTPLKKEVSALEEQIDTLEKQLAACKQRLVEVTQDGFGEEGVRLSREVAKLTKEVETLFGRYEVAKNQEQQIENQFAEN
jgi:ATP-binding cassette subfamily F protein 3